MARAFLTEEAKAALLDAVKTVERRSCAELVIAVRDRSGHYLHADVLAGALGAVVTLTFLLFSPWPFALYAFVLDPIIVALLLAWISWRSTGLRRLLTPRKLADDMVRTAARATFYERGVRHTRDEIGILVYVSLLERRAEVVVDRGIERAVDRAAWAAAVAAIDRAVVDREGGIAVARAITALGDLLEPCLPRSEDDVNELPDEVG